MTVPPTIHAGDTIAWVEPVALDLDGAIASSASWSLTTYLRFNAANEAATITGTARPDGTWSMVIPASATTAFTPGTWAWQTRISIGSTAITVGTGTTLVSTSLAYNGTAAAYDGRSQAEQDLADVQAAIRSLVAKGAKQYTIGSRSFTSFDLPQLIQRESQLKAIVNRERAAEKVAAGLGDPRSMYVRFT